MTAGPRARRHRRHARQDDDDRDDRRPRSPRPVAIRRRSSAGACRAWEGNLLGGGDALYVVEADEYDRSFLALTPTVAVVNNIEADHLDIYTDLADIKRTFAQFVRGARTIVLCADDAGANSLRTPSTAEVIRFGIDSPDARVVASDLALAPDGFVLPRRLRRRGSRRGRRSTIPGRHNVLNALAALSSGLALGARRRRHGARARDVSRRRAALPAVGRSARRGRRRRLRAQSGKGGRRASPPRASRIPGGGSSWRFSRTCTRARAISPREFGASLAGADVVFLTEIYPAREQPIAGVTSQLVGDALDVRRAARWRGAATRSELAEALATRVREGDVVLTIGAGDITKTGPELLERLGRDA